MSRLKRAWHVFAVAALSLYFALVFLQNAQFRKTRIAYDTMHFARCFPIFFMGSLIAFFYKRIDDTGFSMQNHPRASRIVCVLTIVTQIVSVRLRKAYPLTELLTDYYNNALVLALHLFLMLFGSPNVFTDWMGSCRLMRLMGKYSFGIYLFHINVMGAVIWKIPIVRNMLFDDKALAVVGLSFAIGYAFFHIVESRMMRLASFVNERIALKYHHQPLSTSTA